MYNKKITKKGFDKMLKKILILVVSSLGILSLTGCVHSEIRIPEGYWDTYSSVDDMNMSDYNLTESEMMILEQEEANKLPRIPFPEAEYVMLKKLGKGTIKGKIYLTTASGQQVLGENTRLYLNPVTSYSTQWYEESYLGDAEMKKADSRLFNYLKFTASNKQGSFSFFGVPSGNYYLIGTVRCKEECGYETMKNIRIATEVSVMGKEIVQQDLTRVVE